MQVPPDADAGISAVPEPDVLEPILPEHLAVVATAAGAAPDTQAVGQSAASRRVLLVAPVRPEMLQGLQVLPVSAAVPVSEAVKLSAAEAPL